MLLFERIGQFILSILLQVMNNGQVKEFDGPYNLLQDPRSLFYKMVQKTGPSASRKLHQMARDALTSKTKSSSE